MLRREREKLAIERARIEKEKAELLRIERERQKLEREKIELERLELKRQQRKYGYDLSPFKINPYIYISISLCILFKRHTKTLHRSKFASFFDSR